MSEQVSTQLSESQRAVLDAIRDFISANGYPPTVRDLTGALGFTAPSTVHNHLATLQDKGYISRDPNKPRALVLLPPGRELGPDPKVTS